MTIDQACAYAQMSPAFLFKQWALGGGPRSSKVGKKRLVRSDHLDRWLQDHEVL